MKLFLDIPFEEGNDLEKLGLKLDKDYKKWYVSRDMYDRFKKYILDIEEYAERIILKDYFYIIVSPYKCQNCGKEMKVINFGIDNYIKIYDNEEDDDPELSIELEEMDWFGTVMDWSNIPEKLGNFLKENWNYTTFDEQVCPHCNYIQEFFEIEEDWLNPFHPERDLRFPENKFKRNDFEFIKVKLINDILADMDFSYSTEHEDLFHFSKHKESDFLL